MHSELEPAPQRTWIFGLASLTELPADYQCPKEVLLVNNLLTLKALGIELVDQDLNNVKHLEVLLGSLLLATTTESLKILEGYMAKVYIETDRLFKQFPIQVE